MATLRLIGPPALVREGHPPLPLAPERRTQLLAVLGCAAASVARERLAALLWPGRPPGAARNNLRKVLHELRGLGLEELDDDADHLAWRGGSDLADFAAACRAGRWPEAARLGAAPLLQGLERGAELGAAFTQWLREQREQHRRHWHGAVRQALADAQADEALSLAGLQLQADPLDDEALAIYVDAAYALDQPGLAEAARGRRAAHLRQALHQAPHGELRREPDEDLQEDRARPADPAKQDSADARVPLTAGPALVGREAEASALEAALRHQRVVVLLGPGGVGKTCLARHVAARVAPRLARGAVLVPLEDADTPAALPARIATALGLRLSGHGPALDELARVLAPRSQLLVLDGFESIIDAASALARLLDGAPRLHLLVTTRERLPLSTGVQHRLAAWPLPPPGAPADVWRACPAVQLLQARARIVNPGFDAAAAMPAVATVCRLTGGLPLAIELAAAWLRVLSPEELARELAGGPALLAEPDGSLPGLQAVFERSWSLLTAAERRALARLSVCRGGFTRDMAWAVGGADLARLAALVDKSMLAADGPGRFAMHPLLAAFASARLAAFPPPPSADTSEAESAAAAHARHCLGALAQPAGLDSADHDNALAAWQHALARSDAALLQAALPGLARLFATQGRLAEAARLFAATAAACRGRGVLPALLRAHGAWMLLWSGARREARRQARAAATALARHGHPAGRAMALRTLGHAARLEGRLGESEALFREALAESRRAGDATASAMLRDALAMTLNLRGRPAAARRELERAQRHNEAAGDRVQLMYNRFNRAQGHAQAGQPALALPWARQAAALAESLGYAAFRHHAQALLAEVLAALGEDDEAGLRAQQALEGARRAGDASAIVRALEATARVDAAGGRGADAAAALAEAAALALERGVGGPVAAALVPVAARVCSAAAPARSRRWLLSLRSWPDAAEPTRREARSLLCKLPPSAGLLPASMRATLVEIARAGETSAKRPPV